VLCGLSLTAVYFHGPALGRDKAGSCLEEQLPWGADCCQ